MLELVAALVLGCAIGIITGLTPGLHTNTVAIIIFGSIATLTQWFPLIAVGVFLIAMTIVHSFVDFIPSIFLGAPEADTALSVLPGHKLLLQGKGYYALQLTVIGGTLAFVLAIAIVPIMLWIVRELLPYLKLLAGPILTILAVWFILSEQEYKRIFWAAIIFFTAGTLGLVTLDGLNLSQPLFPLLAGLFGISMLIFSISTHQKLPKQFVTGHVQLKLSHILGSVKALLAGSVMSFLPALGPAQAAIVAQALSRFRKIEEFLVILGGINTVDVALTLVTLYAINKPRSGVLVVIQNLMVVDWSTFLIFVTAAFAAVGAGIYLTLKIGRLFARGVADINYKKVSLFTITLVLAMIFVFSGPLGLLVASVATAVGLLAPLAGVRRIHAMGVLMIPVIVAFA